MRISDWSSDVCSSDLFAGEPLAKAVKLNRSGIEPVAVQPFGLNRQMDMGTRRVCMKRQDIIVIVAEFGMGQPANGSQHLVRVSAFGHREDRSEEHTSELQSLMRTSYAVFCLKKKNKIR